MNITYTNQEGFEEFQGARAQFGSIIDELKSQRMLGNEHGEIETMLDREGKELLRRLLQGHLDLRANKEERIDSIMGSDGVERTHFREDCDRPLESLFGEVKVKRMGYSARGAGSIYPSAKGTLKIRALYSSGDLDAYWRFHKEQELKRNHLSRFADYEKMVA